MFRIIDMGDYMKRNYGIDLLKLVSAFMVVVLHLIVDSGFLSEDYILTIPGELTWLIWTFCFCAVLCFAITSGYVGFKKDHKYSNIIYLWLTVLFYTVFFGVIQMIINNNFTVSSFINLFFPVSSRKYWYFSEYVLLYIFMPALDAIVDSLQRKKCKNILLISILLITVYQNIIYGQDFLELSHGYCALWLSIMYCLGAYIKKYAPLTKLTNIKLLLLITSMPLISWAWQLLCRFLFSGLNTMTFIQYFFYRRHTVFISYLSITMVLQASLMVILFSRMNFNTSINKIIKLISPLSFSVYIIHTTETFTKYINNPLGLSVFKMSGQYSPIFFLVYASVVYMLCIIIDSIRNYIFIKSNIKNTILSIANLLTDKSFFNKYSWK